MLKLIPILEEISNVDDVQQFIRSHIDAIDKEHLQSVSYPCPETITKIDKTINTEPQTKLNCLDDIAEEHK